MINKGHATVGAMILLCALSCLSLSYGQNPFAQVKTPSAHPQAVVGSYAKGCIFGAAQLPKAGVGYQTMRQSRNRHYGHQVLVDYVVALGAKQAQTGALLLIGDMSQPRGGLMSADHASHQIGLDVDIWLYPMTQTEFSAHAIESLMMRSVVNRAEGAINAYWRDTYLDLIKDAATPDNVDRIFINSVIKKKLCALAPNAPWQYKVRPWFGHDSHFHVRLKCPKGSPLCTPQAPIPKTSGCTPDLDNWVRDQVQATLNPKARAKPTSINPPQAYPAECHTLLN